MNAPRVASATRLALRRANTSVFRCATETTLPRTAAATARPATTARRCYGTPAYQQYSLYPNNAPPPPRAEGTEPLPVVNETRPPKTPALSPSPSKAASPAAIKASTTLEVEQPRPAQPTKAPTPAPSPQAAAAAAPAPAAAAPAKAARPRPKLRARKAAMKLTPAAVDQLRSMLEGPEPKLIKVGVRNRGCSGLAYHLEWVEKPGSFDEEVAQDGVRVLIDSKALFSIIGSEMDWVEDKLSQRFVFKNPNIKEECGCGESFMV